MKILQEVTIPLLSVNDSSLLVSKLHFNQGDEVKKGDAILAFESSKTTEDFISEVNGFVEFRCEEGVEYNVNEVVAVIYNSPLKEIKSFEPPVQKIPQASSQMPKNSNAGAVLYSKKALEMISNHSISKDQFNGQFFVDSSLLGSIIGLKSGKGEVRKPMPQVKVIDDSQHSKIDKYKQIEIEYLSEIQQYGLISTISTQISCRGTLKKINPTLKFLKDQLLPVIAYESARTLKLYPKLNAYFVNEGIFYHSAVNLGIAIDLGKGLKVVKLENTNEKSIGNIDAEIFELASLYEDEKLQISHISDVTFTITDLSSYQVFDFKPLVNAQNSAILGVSAIDADSQKCNLSLTFDHRVTEGKYAAQFLQELKSRMESYQTVVEISCYKCFRGQSEDLNDIGMIRVTTSDGQDKHVCNVCLFNN